MLMVAPAPMGYGEICWFLWVVLHMSGVVWGSVVGVVESGGLVVGCWLLVVGFWPLMGCGYDAGIFVFWRY